MIPKTLQVASVTINHLRDTPTKPRSSVEWSMDFLPTLKQYMQSVQKKSYYRFEGPPPGAACAKKEYVSYIEHLRNGLLSKGKPLDGMFLKGEDLPALRKLLRHSGLPQKVVEKLLKELIVDQPNKGINFSQLFSRIDELEATKRKVDLSVTLEPSAILSIESMVRNIGLTQKQVDHVLSAARVEGGGLNLHKVMLALREASKQNVPQQHRATLDKFVEALEASCRPEVSTDLVAQSRMAPQHYLARQISEKVKTPGIQNNDKLQKEGNVTERPGRAAELPSEVKATIERILEKAVYIEKKSGATDSHPAVSTDILKSLHSKRHMNTETKLFKFGDGSANAKTEKDEALEAGTFHKSSKLRLPTEMENRGVVEKGPKENRQKITSEVRNIDSPQDTPNTSVLRVITGFTQNSKASRDLIPFYVIDQVGRQISRAVVKGERIIELQLKPPELGMVRVQIDVKNNILRLSMITENSSTKELLLSNVNELRESLVGQGMKVEKIDVEINYNFNQSSTGSNDGLDESQRRIQDVLRLPFVKNSDTENLQAVPRIPSSSNYLLDVIV